ncbi:MAG: sigma-70 family RNA polymerase sigma factor [Evtepia sp.]
MSDDDLISAAKNGDQDAFAHLVTQYEKRIYNLTFRMTGNREDAEELTQTAFLNAWRGLPRFQGDSSFATWLYRLATNCSIDFLRRQKRRKNPDCLVSLDESETQFPDLRYAPEEMALQDELRTHIFAGLNTLTPEHRRILQLRELDDLSYQEIADLLSLEIGTVKSRLARARLSLRRFLLAEGNFSELFASNEIEPKGGDLP